jgi:SAM-dependent methyltransferase
MSRRSTRSFEETASQIFDDSSGRASARWLDYWRSSYERNLKLLSSFEELIPLQLAESQVLDIGCGTGGLGRIVSDRAGIYFGADYHAHILHFAETSRSRLYLQSSALELPFPTSCFDVVFCFDVIEHLTGGRPWQLRFLKELRRVLKRTGLILLTTPNFWHPYDAHSNLWFSHFLPGSLRDRYICWRNPGFIQEHGSFKNIPLVTPRFLRKALQAAGLAPLHGLPCGLDRRDYRSIHPFLGLLPYLGLGWYLHAEFWPILVRKEMREKLRLKLRKNWSWEHAQPSAKPSVAFQRKIDFSESSFGHQIGSGWHYHEIQDRGYRWMAGKAHCCLQTRDEVRRVRVSGFAPEENSLTVWVEGLRVGVSKVEVQRIFEVEFLLPFRRTADQLFEIRLEASRVSKPDEGDDPRQLGLMIFSVALEK